MTRAKTTPSLEDLEEQIETLVGDHIAAVRAAAIAAVQRAVQVEASEAAPAAQSRRVYRAIAAHPGSTALQLAQGLGISSAALRQDLQPLLSSGLVQQKGQRLYPVASPARRAKTPREDTGKRTRRVSSKRNP